MIGDRPMSKKEKKTNKKKKHPILKKILLILLMIILVVAGYLTYGTLHNGGGLTGLLATLLGQNSEDV